MRRKTLIKYKLIQARFTEMYQTERIRIDDCEDKLAVEFHLEVATVRHILKLNLKDEGNTV